jgi:Protein of unknown function (DUF3309)
MKIGCLRATTRQREVAPAARRIRAGGFYFIQPSFGPDAKEQLKTERNPLRFILLIILILLIIGALPTWPYSTGWGYYPSGGLGLLLVIVLLIVLLR